MTPFKVIDEEIAYLELYDDFIISRIKEDVIVDLEEINWLLMIADKYYPNKKFGYIGNRIHNYNLNPITYFTTVLHERLKGLAIVCYSDMAKQTALYEKSFFNKPFAVFDNVEEAKSWILEVLKK